MPSLYTKSLWIHIAIVALLSLAAVIITYCFDVEPFNDIIPHPQFNRFDHIQAYTEIIAAKHMWPWYYGFFIVDLLWAPAILLLFLRVIIWKAKRESVKWTPLVWVFFAAAVLAYSFDFLENITYLTIKNNGVLRKWLESIYHCKIFFYALVIFSFLLFLYQYYLHPYLEPIRRSIKATRFSLIIIVLLLLLATQMDPGSTVIIHLLQSPLNVIGVLFLMNVLALACAHYPDYIDMNIYQRRGISWEMKPEWMRKLGMGFILYTYPRTAGLKANQAPQRQASNKLTLKEKFVSHFRKSIGGVLWLTWIYTLLFIQNKYSDKHFSVNLLIILFIIGYGVLYYACNRMKIEWDVYFTERKDQFETAIKNRDEKGLKALITFKYRILFLFTLISLLLVIILTGVAVYFADTHNWEMSGCFLFLASGLNLMFYILFQNFRKVFSYYQPPVSLRWLLVQYLNDDYIYILFFSIVGLLGLLALIPLTINPAVANPLVFIFIFFYLYYGFFTNMLKHHIYYRKNNIVTGDKWWIKLQKRFFITYVPILPLMMFAWFVFAGQAGNKLHKLEPVPVQGSEVSLDDYLKKYAQQHDSSSYSPILLATYGGGLRASIWTMLLLQTIEDSIPDFYSSTLGMSGVSGGFVGLSLYNVLHTEYEQKEIIKAKIEEIGKHNILSIELNYLLGADLIREMIPYWPKFCHTDRAGRTMHEYVSLIQPDGVKCESILTSSFRDYWGKGFNQNRQGFTPALIGNTTGTHGRYGVAFSARTDTFNTVFPAAVDILTTKEGSIKYLDATSTTERFPLFSPSAQIEGNGHFLDGGYFENSGLLSLMNFFSYLKNHNPDSIPLQRAKCVLIINSKEAYIRKIIGDSIVAQSESSGGELMAILNTLTNTDVLPYSLEAKVKQDFGDRFVQIYLPYPVTYKDVTDLLHGQPSDPVAVQERINRSNEQIDSIWETYNTRTRKVPPALTRLLSDPAVKYLSTMLQHPEVKAEIERLKH